MKEHPDILFDGVCHLCAGSVRFVIKRDMQQRFPAFGFVTCLPVGTLMLACENDLSVSRSGLILASRR